jgi:hypothetical protein
MQHREYMNTYESLHNFIHVTSKCTQSEEKSAIRTKNTQRQYNETEMRPHHREHGLIMGHAIVMDLSILLRKSICCRTTT